MRLDFLRREERTAIELKALYKSYGYKEYKLSGFEDYSLYAEHKSFLDGKGVLSFSESGRLLALRPDVTLSIVKNAADGVTEKLFYDERVYRKRSGEGFSELRQLGVEVIGKVDALVQTEILDLALKTLESVNANCILDVSHTEIILKLFNLLKLSKEQSRFALTCLESKNAHDFSRFAEESGVDKEYAKAFLSLILLPSEPCAALRKLREIAKLADIEEETDELERYVKFGRGKVNINFSAIGDADYYNGAVFKGYAQGVPHAVLSGGRYDRLLTKFGKSSRAVGFALYLGELSKYFPDKPCLPDTVIVYTDITENRALALAEKLRKEGENVLLSRELPENFSGKIIYAEKTDD